MRRGIPYWLLKLRAQMLLVFGLRDAALRCFREMLLRWPGDAYAMASRVQLQAQSGNREMAISEAQALVAQHPDADGAHWFNLAFLLESAGRPAEAEDAFRHALALDPKLDRAWYGLGLALISQGRLDDAVPALQRNTELQPMSPYGWYQLARVQAQRAQLEEVARIIRHLKGFEPKVAAQLERETGLQT